MLEEGLVFFFLLLAGIMWAFHCLARGGQRTLVKTPALEFLEQVYSGLANGRRLESCRFRLSGDTHTDTKQSEFSECG